MRLGYRGAIVGLAICCMAPSRRQENNKYGDHIGAYNFMVEIDNVEAGRFKTVCGLQPQLDTAGCRAASGELVFRAGRTVTVPPVGALVPVKVNIDRVKPVGPLKVGRICAVTLQARVVAVHKTRLHLRAIGARSAPCDITRQAPGGR